MISPNLARHSLKTNQDLWTLTRFLSNDSLTLSVALKSQMTCTKNPGKRQGILIHIVKSLNRMTQNPLLTKSWVKPVSKLLIRSTSPPLSAQIQMTTDQLMKQAKKKLLKFLPVVVRWRERSSAPDATFASGRWTPNWTFAITVSKFTKQSNIRQNETTAGSMLELKMANM